MDDDVKAAATAWLRGHRDRLIRIVDDPARNPGGHVDGGKRFLDYARARFARLSDLVGELERGR